MVEPDDSGILGSSTFATFTGSLQLDFTVHALEFPIHLKIFEATDSEIVIKITVSPG